jgi:hypothetical protein
LVSQKGFFVTSLTFRSGQFVSFDTVRYLTIFAKRLLNRRCDTVASAWRQT